MFLDESCDILTEKEKDLIPSHDQVNHLLSFIAIGELVASSDCKLFMNKFKNEGKLSLYDTYKHIYEDEKKHYNLIRNILHKYIELPDELRALFKGDDLLNNNCIIEKMCLFHIVFESTAMAYIKFLIELPKISKIKRKVLIEIANDEAAHISFGVESVETELKHRILNTSATCELRSRLELSLENHKNVIRKMPHIVFGEDSIIACKISKQFVQYYEINKARLFNEF